MANDVVKSITCPKCGRTSYHPEDVGNGYCGACHDFTREPRLAIACHDCGRVSIFSWWWTERDGRNVQVCADCLHKR